MQIDKIGFGAIQKVFQEGFKRVLDNISDASLPPVKQRTIKVIVDAYPDEQRRNVDVFFRQATTVLPRREHGILYLDKRFVDNTKEQHLLQDIETTAIDGKGIPISILGDLKHRFDKGMQEIADNINNSLTDAEKKRTLELIIKFNCSKDGKRLHYSTSHNVKLAKIEACEGILYIHNGAVSVENPEQGELFQDNVIQMNKGA